MTESPFSQLQSEFSVEEQEKVAPTIPTMTQRSLPAWVIPGFAVLTLGFVIVSGLAFVLWQKNGKLTELPADTAPPIMVSASPSPTVINELPEGKVFRADSFQFRYPTKWIVLKDAGIFATVTGQPQELSVIGEDHEPSFSDRPFPGVGIALVQLGDKSLQSFLENEIKVRAESPIKGGSDDTKIYTLTIGKYAVKVFRNYSSQTYFVANPDGKTAVVFSTAINEPSFLSEVEQAISTLEFRANPLSQTTPLKEFSGTRFKFKYPSEWLKNGNVLTSTNPKIEVHITEEENSMMSECMEELASEEKDLFVLRKFRRVNGTEAGMCSAPTQTTFPLYETWVVPRKDSFGPGIQILYAGNQEQKKTAETIITSILSNFGFIL